MKWELWSNEDKTNHSFFEVILEVYEQQMEELKRDTNEKFHFVWSTEAETYNEAMQKYYDFMGFGKYKPFDDE
jgi:hypothetical protein